MNTVGLKTERVLYEFEGFRVDPVRRRIVRAGEPVPLTPKAFSILLVLLERRGEVVEKEELIQRVWPDTYVTEANLTQNISSLRKALGERAQDSRFVVTVPGQGYSFVADVLEVPRDSTAEMPLPSLVPPAGAQPPAAPEPTPAPAAPLPSSPEAGPPAGAQEAAPANAPQEPPPAVPAVPAMPAVPAVPAVAAAPAELVPVEPRALSLPTGVAPALSEAARREVLAAQLDATGSYPVRRRRGLYMTGVVLLVLAVLTIPLVLLKVRARPASPVTFLSDRRSIAVLPLRNLTGNPNDAWLATALAEMMTTELETDSNLRVVSGGNVTRAHRAVLTGGPAEDAETPEALRKLHELLGADLVVSGSYSILPDNQGGQIRLDLRVFDAPSGDSIAAFADTGSQRQVFDLVSRAGGKLRSSLGWSNLSPEQVRAAQVQRLTSTEAARLYAQGLERLRASDFPGARDILQKAAEADPGSALIHSALAEAWTKLGYDTKAAEEALKARELAAPLPRPQRLAIEARYHETRREWNQAADIYRSLWTFFPDDVGHGLQLALSLSTAARNTEARTVVNELRRLPEPEGQDPRIDLAEAEIAMRMADYTAQREAAERAIEKGEELAEIQIVAQALTLKGDALLLSGNPRESILHYQRARALYDQAGNRPAAEGLLLNLGVAFQQMSQLAEAKGMIETALAAAEKQGSSRNISLLQANLAVLHMDLGDVRVARELLEQSYAAFKEEGDRVREEKALYILSTALMAQGDIAGAQQGLQRVQSLARQTGNRTDLVVTLDDLGVLLARQNSPAQAMRLHNQALAIARSLKDQGRLARVLISTGDTLTQMGALARAQQSYAEAFDHARAMGHRLLVSRTYGGLSRLAYVQGDLVKARGHAENELRIALDAGAQPIVIRARADLAQIYLAAGDLETARQHLDDALKVANALGLELDKMWLHLRLARVALAEGDPPAATALAQEAAEWFGKRKLVADQARALAVLTEALVSGKRLAEAQEVSSRLRALAGTSDDLELRVSATLQAARVGSTAGEVGESFMKMREAEEMARNSGLVAAGLEARLVLGQFQLERLDRVAGRAALESLRREAQAKGFWRVAEHAAEALELRRSAGSPISPFAGR